MAAQGKAKLQRDKPQDKMMKSHAEKVSNIQLEYIYSNVPD